MREPSTVLTNFILAAECLVLGVLVLKNAPLENAARFLSGGLILAGLAAVFGGLFHGWGVEWGRMVGSTVWKLAVYLIGMSTVLILAAVTFHTLSGGFRKGVLVVIIAQFVLYASWMWRHDDFRYVIYNYVPAMIFILALELYAAFAFRATGAWWLIAGVLVSFFGAAVQMSGFRLHRHFNHNDLYHVIQMVAIFLMYRAGLLMHDR